MDSRGTQWYGYDPANQLNDAEVGGNNTSYIYNPANQLNDAEVGGNNTSYIYNGDGVRTARETSSTYTEYVIDHNRSLPVILYDETAFYMWGLDLIARIVGSTQQYYHYDGLGSTRALTNGSGTTVATYNFDVFGAIKSQTGSGTNNFLFTGEWRDPETGFYFLRARYYDPVVGRFITRDPFAGLSEAPQSLNSYVYVTNNPVNSADPSGLIPAPPNLTFEKRVRYDARLGSVLFFFSRFCRGFIDACGGSSKPPLNPVGTGNVSQGAVNGDWAKLSGALRDAAAGKGNFGIGSATREQSQAMGEAWVGSGYRIASDGKTMISADGLRQYRPPAFKPQLDKTQANFESRPPGLTEWQSNAHLDTLD